MIYVVTPVHNRREVTRAFLSCLEGQDFEDFEVVVVDDGSTDGTSAMIAREFSHTTVLKGDGTLWWTGATNKGLRHVLRRAADGDFVLVINDDVEFDRHYLARLHSFALEHPQTLVGSVVTDVHRPDIIIDGGRLRNWTTAKSRILNVGRRLSSFEPTTFFEVSQLTGRGMLAPVRLFREIGLYDSDHFRHRGDTELPVRAQKYGYSLVVYYGAPVASHADLTHPTETGEYHLKDFRRYFFDFRSSGSIAYRFNFARRTASNPLRFVTFLACDLVRSTAHFFLNCEFDLRRQSVSCSDTTDPLVDGSARD